MKKLLSFLLVTGMLFSSAATAHEKVVVVPLISSKVAGTDGQIQYNDSGKTAGAEVYYDKTTGKLEVRGSIVGTDASGNFRLWGEARPRAEAATTSWRANNGIQVAVSTLSIPWTDTEEACPVNTWVCSLSDLDIPNLTWDTVDKNFLACDGAAGTSNPVSFWVADAHTTLGWAKTVLGSAPPIEWFSTRCWSQYVLCCKE